MGGKPRSKKGAAAAVHAAVRAHALSFPGAYEDHPWGETVVKVGKKVFVFLGRPEEGGSFGLSAKLPRTGTFALGLPFASPTGYGLGKAGWVSAAFAPGDDVPVGLLLEWIDESYRAIAPRKLVTELDGRGAAGATRVAGKKRG